MFHGSIVALVTPMLASYKLDEIRLRQLVQLHIAQGTQAIVVNGTTGEAPTLTLKEQARNLEVVIDEAEGHLPVIAGTGAASTLETIHRTEQAMKQGADAALIVTPYYNKPTQAGLYAHYQAIAQALPIPIILYNVPARTGCDLHPRTVADLSSIPNIVGIKEASADRARLPALLALCGDTLDLLSGDDGSALEFLMSGGKGIISVTANVAPYQMQQMCRLVVSKDYHEAHLINQQLSELHKVLFVESNPIPIKWAMQYLKLIEGHCRLPLLPLEARYHHLIIQALENAQLSKRPAKTVGVL